MTLPPKISQKCVRCLFEWYARGPGRSPRCPNCRAQNYWTQRVMRIRGEREFLCDECIVHNCPTCEGTLGHATLGTIACRCPCEKS